MWCDCSLDRKSWYVHVCVRACICIYEYLYKCWYIHVYMCLFRLTQLLEEKTGQLSNHTAVEHPTQSHLARSPEGGRVGVVSPADRERDQSATSSEQQGEPIKDQEVVMGRVLQEADSTTLDHVCQSSEVEESLVAEETRSEARQEANKERGAPQAGSEGVGQKEESGGHSGVGSDQAVVDTGEATWAFQEEGKKDAAEETGQYITGEGHDNAVGVITEDKRIVTEDDRAVCKAAKDGVMDGVQEDQEARSQLLVASELEQEMAGVASNSGEEGAMDTSKSGEDGSGGGSDRKADSLAAKTIDSRGADEASLAANTIDSGGADEVSLTAKTNDSRGADEVSLAVKTNDSRGADEASLAAKTNDNRGADEASLAAKTNDSRGADEATGEVKTSDVGVASGASAAGGANGNDSSDRNDGHVGEEVTRRCEVKNEDVCMETGEASDYSAVRGNDKEEVREVDNVEHCAVGEPAVGMGGAVVGLEEVCGVRVTDEGDWVVVELEVGGAGVGVAGAAAPTGREDGQEAGEGAVARLAKRPRTEDNEEEEAEGKSGDEPVTKQSRLEEEDGKEMMVVVEGVSEEDPAQQDDSRLREEQDAERTDSIEVTESSYMEAATGQVEKVEGKCLCTTRSG